MRRLSAPFLPFALFTFFGLLACDSSPSQPVGGIPFSTLTRSQVPGSAGPQIQTVVRSDGAWSQVWADLWGDRQAPARPAVNFSRDMVVLVTASETCGGDAQIEEIQHNGNDLLIRYGDALPSLCLCIQPTIDFHAVRAPIVFGDARFETRPTDPVCD